MRYMVSVSTVDVIGHLWMPAIGAYTYTLTAHDIDNARDSEGKLTRESVSAWLDTHAGDFQSVDDFSASIEDGPDTVDIDWESEDSAAVFSECMFGSED